MSLSRRYKWIKRIASLIIIILFFIIINGFFRENLRLLDERNWWQDKTSTLEGSLNKLKEKNEELQQKIDQLPAGLIVSELQVEAISFVPDDASRLEYKLSVTVENTASISSPRADGHILFSFRNPGGGNFFRTLWRAVEIPSLRPGEVKMLQFSGRISAQPREEMLIIINIDNQPGLAKERIFLPSLPVKKHPPLEKNNAHD